MRCSQIKGLLLLIALFFYVRVDGQQIIRTLAGDGVSGATPGEGNLGSCVRARFMQPFGVAVDFRGNVYVSDQSWNVVRKIRPDGLIVTYAGTGSLGHSGDGGPAVLAKLQSPKGLICDSVGNLYIADAANLVVRKVDTFGLISTIAGVPGPAGTGLSGAGGPATNAHIGSVSGLAMDAAGNLYIANGNDRVWKVNTSGIISVFAGGNGAGYSGNGSAATAAVMEGITDVMVDASGTVFISEQYNNVVRKVNPATGIISLVAGLGPTSAGSTGDGLAATSARLNSPAGLRKDAAGNLYICDLGNNKIRRITTAGTIQNFAGATGTASGFAGDGSTPGTTTRFYYPTSMSFDAKGHLFIIDQGPGAVGTGGGRRLREIFGVDTIRLTVSPNDTICSSDTVTFTAPLTSGYYSFEYRWKKNGVAVGTNSGTFQTTGLINNDRVSCTLVDTALGGMLLAVSDTIRMTVNPVVAPSISVLITSDTVCSGATANFTTSITNGGSSPSIQWKVSGVTVATGASYSYVPANGDTVTAILTSSAPCAIPNPVSTSRIITVAPLPNAGTISGPTFVCAGSTISLTSSGAAGGIWSASNTSASVSSTGVVTGNSTGTDTISYSVTTPTCGNATATYIITMGSLPVAGTIVGSTFVCPGSVISLTNASSGGVWSATNASATISSTGVVTGATAGQDTIRYTVTNTCGTDIASLVVTIGADPVNAAGTVTGPSTVCLGSSITLADTATTGFWVSTNTAIATVSTAGVVSTISTGVDTIYYISSGACYSDTASHVITVDAVLSAGSITGLSAVCPGFTIALSATTMGGVWSASNGNATVSSTGVVTGVTSGQDTVSYTVSNSCNTSVATIVITVGVSSLQDAGVIVGPGTACVGSTISLSDTATGGYWLSLYPGIATVDTAGIVSGVTAGTDTILYIVTSGCNPDTAFYVVTVLPVLTADTIAGPATICMGSPLTLTNAAGGGAWSSSNPSVGTINGAGQFTTLMPGTTVISYIVGNTCGSDTATHTITVAPLPFADTITGALLLCVGTSSTLVDTASGGIWSSSSPTVATVTSTGVMTGLASGSANITYSVTNSCGTDFTVHHVSVNPFPTLSSSATPPSICSGTLFNYTPTSTTAGATFNWIRSAIPEILNPTAGSAGDPNEILISTSVLPVSVVYAFAISAGGCATVQNVTVIVKPKPTLSSSDTVVTCAGRLFTYVPASLTPGTSYAWTRLSTAGISPSTGSGFGNISETYAISGSSSISTIVIYTLTAGGCTGTQNVNLTVEPQGPPPPAITTTSPSWLCSGTMFQNFGTSSVPDTTVTYEWGAVGATVWAQGTGHQYSLINFTTPGTAMVYLATSNVGFSCRSLDSFAVFVDNNLNETISLNYFGGVFIAQPGMSTYQWGYDDAITLDSTILAGETGENYALASPDFAGKHYWVITEHFFCKQKTYYNMPVGVVNVNGGGIREVTISPNPNNGSFTLNVASDVTEQGTIIVTNMLGSKVQQMQCTTNKKADVTIDQPAGIYFVTISTAQGKHVEKVMITR